MGLKKWVKRVGREVKEQVKNTGRQVLEIHGQVGKVAIPVVAGVASYFVPGSGLAITAAARPIQRYAIASGLRGSSTDMSSHEIRQEARAQVNRTSKYAVLATGLGTAAGFAFPAYGSTTTATAIGPTGAAFEVSTVGASSGSLLSAGTALGGSQALLTGYELYQTSTAPTPSTTTQHGDSGLPGDLWNDLLNAAGGLLGGVLGGPEEGGGAGGAIAEKLQDAASYGSPAALTEAPSPGGDWLLPAAAVVAFLLLVGN